MESAFKVFVGQVMKAEEKGKANPAQVKELIG